MQGSALHPPEGALKSPLWTPETSTHLAGGVGKVVKTGKRGLYPGDCSVISPPISMPFPISRRGVRLSRTHYRV